MLFNLFFSVITHAAESIKLVYYTCHSIVHAKIVHFGSKGFVPWSSMINDIDVGAYPFASKHNCHLTLSYQNYIVTIIRHTGYIPSRQLKFVTLEIISKTGSRVKGDTYMALHRPELQVVRR